MFDLIFKHITKYLTITHKYFTVPEAPPQNLIVEEKSTSEILVKWTPPPVDKTHGIITQYETICTLQCDQYCTDQSLLEVF